MEMLSHLSVGLETALQPINLLYCFAGVLLGTVVGILPGVGPLATIALLLPVTYALSPETALIMIAGIYYGAQYGGSTTAILINLPGEASSVVTSIDGHQMARQGRAGQALAIAAIGSFVAGTVATVVIAVAAVPLTGLALKFSPAEYFSLIVLGLICSVALARGSTIKALSMIVLGLAIALVGTDIYTGTFRFNFGFLELSDGIDVAPLAVGLFGLSEILKNLESDQSSGGSSTAPVTKLMPSRAEIAASAMPIARGTVVGSLLGILPGGGAILSSFASYAAEKKLSKTPERFGHGAIEGVAGPEAANNAGAQTSFIPMLTLGLPSNPVMALMIGAMIIHGIVPGPNVITNQPSLFWGLIVSMWVGNLMLLVLNLPLVGLWIKLLKIPYYVLFVAIIVFSTVGVYSIGGNMVHLYVASAFGLLGYTLYRLDFEPAPLLIGFVLGPLLEENLRSAMLYSRGDPSVFITRPGSATILLLAAVVLAFVSIPKISRKRDEVFVQDD